MAANRGLHRFAVLTAGATLGLIFAGGLVTSTGSGLAVPDWPLSYGQLMPPMVGGVAFEHGHRMAAATVGLLMLILALWIFRRETRRWVGQLAALALLAVVLQGALGGLTVLLLLPPAVSVAHACLAQAFLCLTVALAVVTGPAWTRLGEAAPATSAPSLTLRRLTLVLPACVFVQLILGAVMRHTHAGLAIPDFPLSYGRLVPPLTTFPVIIHFAHRAWGVVVACVVVACAVRVRGELRGAALLTRPALAALALVAGQILLGGAVIWTRRAVVPTTLHVATGAAILACALILALRCHRLAWACGMSTRARGARLSTMESPA